MEGKGLKGMMSDMVKGVELACTDDGVAYPVCRRGCDMARVSRPCTHCEFVHKIVVLDHSSAR